MKNNKKKVAIFDIDGTIFRSSLLIELTDGLVQSGIFKDGVRRVYAKSCKNWLDRKDIYEKYILGVIQAFEKNIKGVSYKKFLAVVKKIAAFHKNRVYRYTRDLVSDLKKQGYYLLAISNSPKPVLDEFCNNLKFDKVYGRIYDVNKAGKFTGVTLYKDLISNKAAILNRAIEKENLTLKNSIGVGDTESDINFLELVDRPICFNPNKKLWDYARKQPGWEIIVERKDVIYHFCPKPRNAKK